MPWYIERSGARVYFFFDAAGFAFFAAAGFFFDAAGFFTDFLAAAGFFVIVCAEAWCTRVVSAGSGRNGVGQTPQTLTTPTVHPNTLRARVH